MKSSLLLALLLLSAPVAAQRLPDLGGQAAWTEKEKQEFLKYIKSDRTAVPSGQVKAQPASRSGSARAHRARYIALGFSAEELSIDNSAARVSAVSAGLGPRLLAGGHLFSWARYYGGLRYGRLGQERLDGTIARLSHTEIPAGIELALIPLGTPHTRYILIRGGVSAHNFAGARKAEFAEPLIGWRMAWNLGLGYEWQFPNSSWRANIAAEGYKSFSGRSPQFYGMGAGAGVAYTF
ncbi:MAG: hypothetical protein FD189_493 [Elusimicrobia bacterium]|nr:MAG: hypothetical protein FD154_1749 [Elusimicrobiota bacterium]KAF0157479.1 MAG: hypothetical protein FD189_493 [Elusimicrobiota bacterium]